MQNLHLRFLKKYKTLQESIDLHDYVSEDSFNYEIKDVPYKHVVIDNFFKEEFVEKLKSTFDKTMSLGLSENHSDKLRFRLFDPKIKYDGYLFTPQLTDEEPFNPFFSLAWNEFFSKIFKKPTTFGTSFAFHHHPPYDKTGWVHNDYATFLFPQMKHLPNGVHVAQGEEKKNQPAQSQDVSGLLEPYKQKRGIAILYYFNNEVWKEGDGGETGMYTSKDVKSLVSKIAPVNNRLLAFEISLESFHAFQENNKDRNSCVQWFHTDLEWCKKHYGSL